MVARVMWVWGMGQGGQRIQISVYKMSKFWGYKAEYGDCHCIMYSQVARRAEGRSGQ